MLSRCAAACFASTRVTIASSDVSRISFSFAKSVCATGVGSARPLVSTRIWSSGARRGDAAHATVGELEDLLVRAHHELGIDVDLAELVLDHRDAVAVLLRQDVVQQRGFPRAEKTGEDGHGNGVQDFSLKACRTCSGVIG